MIHTKDHTYLWECDVWQKSNFVLHALHSPKMNKQNVSFIYYLDF